jgi:hypothetical protein
MPGPEAGSPIAGPRKGNGEARTTRPSSWTSRQPKFAVCWQLDPATVLHPATTH